jgi:hypothetical protein
MQRKRNMLSKRRTGKIKGPDIKALEEAMMIYRAIRDAEEPIGVAELSEITGLPTARIGTRLKNAMKNVPYYNINEDTQYNNLYTLIKVHSEQHIWDLMEQTRRGMV